MRTEDMTPGTLFAESVAKSAKDFVFTLAWAAATIYLLLPLWWWLAAASFAALVLVLVLELLRVAGLAFALPIVIDRLDSGRAYHVFAVLAQVVELLAGLALCVWVYLAIF